MLQPATSQEQIQAVATTMETLLLQKLETVDKGVVSIKHAQDLLNTKLFGDPSGENDGGRLPRIELLAQTTASTVEELRGKVIRDGPTRIEALERGIIRDGEERLNAAEKAIVRTGVITAIMGTLGGLLAGIAMKLLFHV